MKREGFTLIELLAVMVILGLLIIITIPAYTTIYTGIRRNNLGGKLAEIETAAKKYGDLIKDDIKDAPGSCLNISVADLIKKGYITSEEEASPVIYNPTNNQPLDSNVKLCYCPSDFDIEAYYALEFNKNEYYYEGDIVEDNNKLYKCVINYKKGAGINGTVTDTKSKKYGKRYFQEVTC